MMKTNYSSNAVALVFGLMAWLGCDSVAALGPAAEAQVEKEQKRKRLRETRITTAVAAPATPLPSDYPSEVPSLFPTFEESDYPSGVPSLFPTFKSSDYPSDIPSLVPTFETSDHPTEVPSHFPSLEADVPVGNEFVFPWSNYTIFREDYLDSIANVSFSVEDLPAYQLDQDIFGRPSLFFAPILPIYKIVPTGGSPTTTPRPSEILQAKTFDGLLFRLRIHEVTSLPLPEFDAELMEIVFGESNLTLDDPSFVGHNVWSIKGEIPGQVGRNMTFFEGAVLEYPVNDTDSVSLLLLSDVIPILNSTAPLSPARHRLLQPDPSAPDPGLQELVDQLPEFVQALRAELSALREIPCFQAGIFEAAAQMLECPEGSSLRVNDACVTAARASFEVARVAANQDWETIANVARTAVDIFGFLKLVYRIFSYLKAIVECLELGAGAATVSGPGGVLLGGACLVGEIGTTEALKLLFDQLSHAFTELVLQQALQRRHDILRGACGGALAAAQGCSTCEADDEDDGDDDDDPPEDPVVDLGLPFSALVYGDPHIVTFDGLRYSCHAVGEFIVAKSTSKLDFEIQGRFEPASLHTALTVVTAVVISTGVDNPVVQINRPTSAFNSSSPLTFLPSLYINGKPSSWEGGIDHRTLDLEVVQTGANPMVRFRDWNSGLVVEFRSSPRGDVTLKVEVAARYRDSVVGLLGSPNGNVVDELVNSTGGSVDFLNLTLEQIGHTWNLNQEAEFGYDYCTSNWCIQQETNSLFTYLENHTFEDYHRCNRNFSGDWLPSVEEASDEVRAICGNDIACLLDGIEMGADGARSHVEQLESLQFITWTFWQSPAMRYCGQGLWFSPDGLRARVVFPPHEQCGGDVKDWHSLSANAKGIIPALPGPVNLTVTVPGNVKNGTYDYNGGFPHVALWIRNTGATRVQAQTASSCATNVDWILEDRLQLPFTILPTGMPTEIRMAVFGNAATSGPRVGLGFPLYVDLEFHFTRNSGDAADPPENNDDLI